MNFADELAAFRARTADLGCDALILLGTRQATTAALLIGTLRVQRVAFLLTNETRGMPDQVAALLGCASDGWVVLPGDHSTTLRVYEWYARNVLLRYREHCRVLEPPELVALMRETAISLERIYVVSHLE